MFMSIFSTSAFATEHKVSNVDLNSLIKISSSEFPDAYIISEFYDDNGSGLGVTINVNGNDIVEIIPIFSFPAN